MSRDWDEAGGIVSAEVRKIGVLWRVRFFAGCVRMFTCGG